jgi:hypothetical protein
MTTLFQRLGDEVARWRETGFLVEDYPALAEVFDWARVDRTETLRYLRPPQLRALEVYWYLRIVKKTRHIFDLYRELYPRQSELLAALGLDSQATKDFVLDQGIDALWDRIRKDDDFVQSMKLESLRETLTLAYPSYILALAMGAGKTILIGAIIATEFALALEYPNGPFVQNALVFAPGKTIIESLRELAEIPYDRILPPRLHKQFAASVKLTFTRDGEKDVPVVRGSSFNIVVTNTEKIRIQKETIRKSDLGGLFSSEQEDQAKAEVANLRLQAIASLPHLAVFSDEAHHTYGQSLDTGLKKVRKTVDYLAANTSLVCVVNTTGTPYFRRQPLKDVVVWYGLSEGIRDGILKDLAGNIQAYDFDGNVGTYVRHVIHDFFKDYRDVRLPNGAWAKVALYFPQTDDLRDLRPVIDQALVEVGLSPALALVNTSDERLTSQADIDAFNRLNDPSSPHRVVLLVNKGTEGWNCPSLFSCVLVRKLTTSNNFVLQASTRCLRQIPGNDRRARVYLSKDNFSILDRQLREAYGETIEDLNRSAQETRRARIVLRKLDIPPLVVTQVVRTVVRRGMEVGALKLERPSLGAGGALTETIYTVAMQQASHGVLVETAKKVVEGEATTGRDAYDGAVELAARYRVSLWEVYDELRRLFGEEDVPASQFEDLARQIEEQTRAYDVKEERVDVALALVKPTGFKPDVDADGAEIFTADIVYPKDRESLLLGWEQMAAQNKHGFGFHYSPYEFDSNPEKSFFEQLLFELNLHPDDIEDIYFTGALTDPGKSDFFVEYKDDKGKWRRYTPDFVIRRKPPTGRPPGSGRAYIVEVKKEHDRSHPVDGETGKKAMALRRWEELAPERLKYEMVFTDGATVAADQLAGAREFVRGGRE